jgi:hypothetical protein
MCKMMICDIRNEMYDWKTLDSTLRKRVVPAESTQFPPPTPVTPAEPAATKLSAPATSTGPAPVAAVPATVAVK